MKIQLSKNLFFSRTMDFLEVYIPQTHESAKTKKTYQDGLTIFRRYVTDTKGISIKSFEFKDCTFDFVLKYRNWLTDTEKRKNSTVNNRIAAIKSYLRYASDIDITLTQVFLNVQDVPFLKAPKEIRPILDEDVLKDLLDAPPNTRTGVRDTMILSMLFDTMIRADELLSMDTNDVQFRLSSPYILVHGKGNKERTVPMSDELVSLVSAYMDEFHTTEIRDENGSEPFIYTTIHDINHRMSERNLERIVKKYADIVRKTHPEMPSSVYPHMFRRTRGTGMYRDGVPVEAIAAAMGHANIQTTKDHYAFPSLDQKKDTMNKGNGLVISRKDAEREYPEDEAELARLCGLR
ncbi:MAG: tyrosine-type recombinase/integrase [Oscillospiraceae bacterium]|nr:tyrosine-type recombinase/integrase [Clostridia bacterium]MBR0341776.1 tyrosine-type recombinase/integrase [Oscillospiraceae bacterium]